MFIFFLNKFDLLRTKVTPAKVGPMRPRLRAVYTGVFCAHFCAHNGVDLQMDVLF
jgi:hypothetical protein